MVLVVIDLNKREDNFCSFYSFFLFPEISIIRPYRILRCFDYTRLFILGSASHSLGRESGDNFQESVLVLLLVGPGLQVGWQAPLPVEPYCQPLT